MASEIAFQMASTVTGPVKVQTPAPATSQTPEPAPVITLGSGKVEPQSGKASPEVAEPQQVEEAVERLNKYLSSEQRNLQFSIDEYTGRSIVSVVDAETGDVIRQIPGEETLRIARALDEMGIRLIDVRS